MTCALIGLIWSLIPSTLDRGAPPVCEVISVGTPKPAEVISVGTPKPIVLTPTGERGR